MTSLHVLFKIADAEYVLPASDVVHMESFEGAVHVPGAPPWVAGLVQIRGRVVPVVDLRARFGLPPAERGLGARVVVVQSEGRQFGLLVDSAREVLQISGDSFKPPPDVVERGSAGYIDAVAQAGPRLVMRIDPRRVVGSAPLPNANEAIHGEQR